MSAQPEPRQRSHPWMWVAAVVLALIFYVFSIGPAWGVLCRYVPDHFGPTWRWYGRVYAPMLALSRNYNDNQWLSAYCGWWQVVVSEWDPPRSPPPLPES